MKTPLCASRLATLAALSLTLATSVSAQTAPAAPAKTDETTYTLSPFEVTVDRDVGYTAANSLAGGRTDAPLKDTPAAVSVLTREFLDDLAIPNFAAASEWSVNSTPTYLTGDSSVNGGYTVSFRGLSASFPTRNYFIWYLDSDNYNTERLEFARGPNGVLFGDSNMGGIPTVWTKRANFYRNFQKVGATFDSYGGHRFSADVNHVFKNRLALRLNLLDTKVANWREGGDWTRQAAHLAGTVRLTERNNFRFEGEYGRFDRQIVSTYYQDLASTWDGLTTFNGTTTPSTGKGIARVSSSAYFLDIPAEPGLGYANWTNSYQTGGTSLALEPTQRTFISTRFPVLPSREFNAQQPDTIVEIPYYTFTTTLDHKVGDDFFAELAYNQTLVQREAPNSITLLREWRIDVNEKLPNGQPNPKFLVPYTDRTRQRAKTDNAVSDLRAMIAWRHQFKYVFQNLNVIAGSRIDAFKDYAGDARRVNGTNPNVTAAENIYRVRIYYDEPGAYNWGPLPNLGGAQIDWVPTAATDQIQRIDYAQAASRTALWSDRINLLAGVRYDEFYRRAATLNGAQDPVTGIRVMGTPVESKISTTSYNGGFVAFPLRWFGIFGNYSETFAPPGAGANLIDGSAPDISRSSGTDFGIKVSLPDNKLYLTLSRYNTKQINQLAFTNVRQTEINRIWTNLGRVDLATVNYRDSRDFEASGYEFEVTANPTRSLRLTANYARPDNAAINLNAGLRAYYDANLATWQAGANDASNPNRAQIQTDLTNIKSTLDAAVPGVLLTNTFSYTANAYATYTFRDGAMKNLSVGAGGNFRGRGKIGAEATNPFAYVFSPSYYLLTAHATYMKKFGKVNARFQLNVSNLLNNRDPVYLSTSTYRQDGISTNPLMTTGATFRWLEPRKFTLSTTLEF
ncbi:MAG: TonB-dependent receptor [Candidatus Didemnitutus sp.]|nr:TonB-dependent receptor [Candidatus Didemnitutus sp.]